MRVGFPGYRASIRRKHPAAFHAIAHCECDDCESPLNGFRSREVTWPPNHAVEALRNPLESAWPALFRLWAVVRIVWRLFTELPRLLPRLGVSRVWVSAQLARSKGRHFFYLRKSPSRSVVHHGQSQADGGWRPGEGFPVAEIVDAIIHIDTCAAMGRSISG